MNTAMDNLINIEEYKNPKILLPKKTYSLIFILTMLLIILISLLFLKYDYFYKGIGVVSSNNIIETKISYFEADKLLNSNKLMIDKNKFSYKINNVSVPLIENNIPYQNIVINVNKLNKSQNMIVEFKVKYDTKYGFEIIKDLIFGKD